MKRNLILLVSLIFLASCSSNLKQPGLDRLVVEPFVIVQPFGGRLEVMALTGDSAGANVFIGENSSDGFLVSKNLTRSLLRSGPEKFGVAPEAFLAELIDGKVRSAHFEIYREAFGIKDGVRTLSFNLGDWFFIAIDAEPSPVVYGVNNHFEMGFEVFNEQDFEGLVRFVKDWKFTD